VKVEAAMMCKHPFMRTIGGKVRWSTRMTDEEKLDATPFPCGRCLHCKINQRRIWTHRIMLELSCHDDGCFVTLTYDDDHIPDPPHLQSDDLTKYLKRLRRRYDKPIRFFAVGEYGDKTERPHYHLALFGVSYLDADIIDKSWGLGFVQVGDLNRKSAGYIAGYVVKKMTSKTDPRLNGRTPEFMRSSRQNGGIGFGAVKRIAKKLKEDKNYDGFTIRDFTYGKNKKLPLGRYLTAKLCEELGIPEDQLKADFIEYQHDIFDVHAQDYINDYYFSVQNEQASERHAQLKRYKIYNRRSL
jgi:hypothetical protein